jgi:hypothetical protein
MARAASAVALVLAPAAAAVRAGDGPIVEPLAPATEAVSVLKAARDGLLQVDARGNGEDSVQVAVRNVAARPLRVVFPPGLVAAATVGQGFQSMGLGTPTSTPGGFGSYRGGGEGFRAMPVRETTAADAALVLQPGQASSFDLPSVCLNFGLPTPTPANAFVLMDVADYSRDPRAIKALRSLATLGTSQAVAQAVAWNVFNDMSFRQMATQGVKTFNPYEIALAARFVQALDSASAAEIVEPGQLQAGRLFVRLTATGEAAARRAEFARAIETGVLLGLPVRLVEQAPGEEVGPSALLLDVTLTPTADGAIAGTVNARVRYGPNAGWGPLGQTSFAAVSGPEGLAASLDRAIASEFVTARIERKSGASPSLVIKNRLPFTIASATFRAGRDADSGTIQLDRLGVGPARSARASVTGNVAGVEHVELNGL